jgi:hypothetical protein
MTNAIRYACRRLASTIAATFVVIGLAVTVLLVAPVVELQINPPTIQWEIVQAERRGDTLSWHIAIDKRRNCSPATRWLARWGDQTATLHVITPTGQPFVDGVGVFAGNRLVVGPFTAMIPRGWHDADGIRIDALVSYDCGTPWRLPPMDVSEQVAIERSP